jgi:hypothetical protein
MRCARVFGMALVLLTASLVAQALEAPIRVSACSCVAPMPTLAELAREPGTSIILASVGQALPDRTPLVIEGWFHGPAESDVIWIRGGANMGTSCDVFLDAGSSYVLVLYRGEDGLYSTNSCTPSGQIGTEAGDHLVAEAMAIFGTAKAPPSPEPEPAAPVDLAPWTGGLVWVAAAAGAGIMLFGLIALLARRRPSD